MNPKTAVRVGQKNVPRKNPKTAVRRANRSTRSRSCSRSASLGLALQHRQELEAQALRHVHKRQQLQMQQDDLAADWYIRQARDDQTAAVQEELDATLGHQDFRLIQADGRRRSQTPHQTAAEEDQQVHNDAFLDETANGGSQTTRLKPLELPAVIIGADGIPTVQRRYVRQVYFCCFCMQPMHTARKKSGRPTLSQHNDFFMTCPVNCKRYFHQTCSELCACQNTQKKKKN
ncbi:hypothetical protein niasHT_008217 [Heterodera trifolii]|uniref:Uncharacterized protein n=1 Tax=Heterodera trifolii TaxID=157864 RepID=A0ABD2LW77_9BILA